jgi:hypothetical protein
MLSIIRHKYSGEQYAIVVNDDNEIIAAIGPLYYADVQRLTEDMVIAHSDMDLVEFLTETFESHDIVRKA